MAGRRRAQSHTRSARQRRGDAELVLDSSDASLLDIVDNVLNKGVVLSGDLTIALAQVDLIYARLSLLLCAADRVLPAHLRAARSGGQARPAARSGGQAGHASRSGGQAPRMPRHGRQAPPVTRG
jgi:hypothetical protein